MPSARLLYVALVAAVIVGLAGGLAGYTFVYAKGASYLSNDPAVYINCHLMNDQYHAWTRGSHHDVAVCIDCHMPHNVVLKLGLKAWNGFRHSWMFTTGDHPDYVLITPINRAVTERQCRACHRPIVEAIDARPDFGMALDCVRCHRSVGHLE
jgi:cytochrome c nitrite reductase small subunit